MLKKYCQDKIISTGAHVDSGFLTLLETFGQPGLELELDGEWRSVLVSQNLLVVNIGEQLGKGFSNHISLQPDVVDL